MRLRSQSARVRIAMGLAPLALTVGIPFAGGMALAFVQSVGFFPAVGEAHLTAAHYLAFVTDSEFRDSLLVTLGLATAATMVSALIGLFIALFLRKATQRYQSLAVLVQVPLAVPHIVMALFVLELLAPSGLIARVVCALGIIHSQAAFPALINDRFGIGIIFAYALKEAPFIALMLLAVLLRIGDDYDAVARTLGASRWQRLRYVTLPMIFPALLSSSLLVFAFVCGAYEVPLLLGRQFPAMLPVVAQQKFMNVDLTVRPDAIAVGMVIAFVTFVIVLSYMRLARALSTSERTLIF